MARKRREIRSNRLAASKIQQHARDQADEEARCIPCQLLHEARQQYIAWQEFCFWARSIMEDEGSLPSWLAAEIADRCPGFLEDDFRYASEHPGEGFLTPVRLGFWIDDHIFELAKKAVGSMPSLTTRFGNHVISARTFAGLNVWTAGVRRGPSAIRPSKSGSPRLPNVTIRQISCPRFANKGNASSWSVLND